MTLDLNELAREKAGRVKGLEDAELEALRECCTDQTWNAACRAVAARIRKLIAREEKP